ncbi:mucin-2-like, partial [Physella acuta]|uniref:mucin-2-like n=1 Tax=Physella acuta TaxID=109671 RepID=UPI0027DCE9F8
SDAVRADVTSRSRRDKEKEVFSELSSLLPQELIESLKPDKLTILKLTLAYLKCRKNVETERLDQAECLAPESDDDPISVSDWNSPDRPSAMLDKSGNLVAGTLLTRPFLINNPDIELPESVLFNLRRQFLCEDKRDVDLEEKMYKIQRYKEGLEAGMRDFLRDTCPTLVNHNTDFILKESSEHNSDIQTSKSTQNAGRLSRESLSGFQSSVDSVSVVARRGGISRVTGLDEGGEVGGEVTSSAGVLSEVRGEVTSSAGVLSEGSEMLEAMHGFFLMLDKTKTVIFVSKNVFSYLGQSQHNIIGQDAAELIYEKDYPELVRQMDDGQFEKDSVSGVKGQRLKRTIYLAMKCWYQKPGSKIKHSGYSLFQWNVKLSLYRDRATGQVKVKQLLSVCCPIRNNMVTGIQTDQNMFITRHALDYKVVYCDARIHDLLGYNPSDLIGTDGFSLKHPCDALMCLYNHRHLISRGSDDSGYYRMLTRAGSWVWGLSQCTVSYDRHGTPQYVICKTFIVSKEEAKCVLSRERQDYRKMKCQELDFDLTTTGLKMPTLADNQLKRKRSSPDDVIATVRMSKTEVKSSNPPHSDFRVSPNTVTSEVKVYPTVSSPSRTFTITTSFHSMLTPVVGEGQFSSKMTTRPVCFKSSPGSVHAVMSSSPTETSSVESFHRLNQPSPPHYPSVLQIEDNSHHNLLTESKTKSRKRFKLTPTKELESTLVKNIPESDGFILSESIDEISKTNSTDLQDLYEDHSLNTFPTDDIPDRQGPSPYVDIQNFIDFELPEGLSSHISSSLMSPSTVSPSAVSNYTVSPLAPTVSPPSVSPFTPPDSDSSSSLSNTASSASSKLLDSGSHLTGVVSPESMQEFHTIPSSSEVFQTSPAFSQVFHTQPESSQVFQTSTASSQVFHTQPESSQLFQTSPAFSQVFHTQPESSQVFQTSTASLQVFHTQPESSQVFQTSPASSQVFHTPPAFSQVFHNTPAASPVFHSSPKQTQVFQSLTAPNQASPNSREPTEIFNEGLDKLIEEIVSADDSFFFPAFDQSTEKKESISNSNSKNLNHFDSSVHPFTRQNEMKNGNTEIREENANYVEISKNSSHVTDSISAEFDQEDVMCLPSEESNNSSGPKSVRSTLQSFYNSGNHGIILTPSQRHAHPAPSESSAGLQNYSRDAENAQVWNSQTFFPASESGVYATPQMGLSNCVKTRQNDTTNFSGSPYAYSAIRNQLNNQRSVMSGDIHQTNENQTQTSKIAEAYPCPENKEKTTILEHSWVRSTFSNKNRPSLIKSGSKQTPKSITLTQPKKLNSLKTPTLGYRASRQGPEFNSTPESCTEPSLDSHLTSLHATVNPILDHFCTTYPPDASSTNLDLQRISSPPPSVTCSTNELNIGLSDDLVDLKLDFPASMHNNDNFFNNFDYL